MKISTLRAILKALHDKGVHKILIEGEKDFVVIEDKIAIIREDK